MCAYAPWLRMQNRTLLSISCSSLQSAACSWPTSTTTGPLLQERKIAAVLNSLSFSIASSQRREELDDSYGAPLRAARHTLCEV